MMKLISIIIPAFNEQQYLPQLLNSIDDLHICRELIEVIVVDSGSTDDTAILAEKRGAKVISTERGFASKARNCGAYEANGDIFAFVDADCLLSINWASNIKNYIENQDVVAVGARATINWNHATWVEKAWSVLITKGLKPKEVDWISSSNLIIKKTAFFSVEGFNESLETGEDVDICFRLKDKGKIIFDPNIKVIHLREPKTVNAFFRKQIWHGKHNVKGLFSHKLTLSELPSLLIPFLYLISIICIIINLFLFEFYNIFFLFSFLFSISIANTSKAIIKFKHQRDLVLMIKVFTLLNIYLFSRSLAFFMFLKFSKKLKDRSSD